MAGKLVCLSMQWLIIWRQFYTAQSQFRIHSAPNETGPRVFFCKHSWQPECTELRAHAAPVNNSLQRRPPTCCYNLVRDVVNKRVPP